MATVGRRPQSWSQLASSIYQDLNSEQAEAARAKHAKWQEDLLRPYGFVRTRPQPEHPDWFPRRGAPKR
jgi:hypothetical protein